jgi:hypothetical protein
MLPLKVGCIRILHLEAGANQAPIRIRLSQVYLDSPPAYDALSYVWGPKESGFTITCDGRPKSVTRNLLNALPFLRLPDRERVLWVDALCIDQDNKEERNQQVGMMKDIYQNASQVLIWLGKESEADRVGIAMLNVFKLSIDINDEYQYHFDQNATDGIMPPVSSSAWTGLVKLFQRDWFSRVWVIQEVVKATKVSVLCGPKSVDWDLIVQVSRACQKIGYLGGYTIESAAHGTHSAHIIDFLKSQGEEATMMKLLPLTRKYKATEGRDKVIALLGMAVDRDKFGPADCHLPYQEVFYNVARCSLSEMKSLDCLSSAGLSTTRKPGLPTWIPDWTDSNDNRFIIGDSPHFSAALTTTPNLQILPDKTLRIKGYAIGAILHVNHWTRKVEEENINPGLPAEELQVRLREKRALESCDRLIAGVFGPAIRVPVLTAGALQLLTGQAPSSPATIEQQQREETLWRTLCCNLTVSGEKAPARYGEGFKLWRMIFGITDNNGQVNSRLGDRTAWERHQADAREYEHAYRKYTFGRSLCITGRGRLGSVPCCSRAGDKICLFKGGRVPFIVRDIGNGYCQLVGECYMHGIMDGEAMMQQGIGNFEQDFWIK